MALGRAGARLVAGDAAQLCVAGVALGDIHLRFAWNVWHLATSTCVLRGRCGTWSLPLWHLATSTFVSHGRCGTWSHSPSFCVAGVALMALGWFWWRAWARLGALGRAWSPVTAPNFAWQAWHLATSIFVSRGRCGAWRHPPAFCVAGVALGHFLPLWHLATSTFVSRGRCGTWRHPPSFCVAGVALMALCWLWWRAWARWGALGRR